MPLSFGIHLWVRGEYISRISSLQKGASQALELLEEEAGAC